mgnify:CR=1 FL=1
MLLAIVFIQKNKSVLYYYDNETIYHSIWYSLYVLSMVLSLVGTINVLQWILCACNEWNDDKTLLKQIRTLSCYKWDDNEALNKSVTSFMLLVQQQDNLRINYKIINKQLSNKNSMQKLIDELIPNRDLFI